MTVHTDDERMQKVNEVDQYRREGMNAQQAVQKAGITYFIYNGWKNKFGLNPKAYKERTAEEWAPIIAEYEQRKDQLTLKGFCLEKGIKPTTFLSALSRSRKQAEKAVRTIVPLVHTNGSSDEIKILKAENLELRLLISDYALDIQALKKYSGRS